MLTQLNLVIVGHTNVGKTSFLRALSRDSKFGLVSNKPGTTRHVESIKLTLKDSKSINFYDTPGLEDSIALYDYLNQIIPANSKADGIDKLTVFLQSPEAQASFEQEAKVIRQLLKSDAAIYVIDVREPVLPKYHDELAILAQSGKPVLAVMNFTEQEQQNEKEWKRVLSRVGIHAIIRFDVIFPPIDGEERLYQSLALLIEPAKIILDEWLVEIVKIKKSRNQSADLIIADALVDVVAYSEMVKLDDIDAIERMRTNVRNREQKAIDELLSLYQFDAQYESEQNLPLIKGRYDTDLFSVEALKMMGIHLSKGLASGAVIGLGIDIAVGGATLGTAALLGAAIGGITQTAKHYGSLIRSRFSGYSKLSVDDVIICFLSLRLIRLKESLNNRSHANASPIVMSKLDSNQWEKGILPKSLKVARNYWQWSTLNKGTNKHDEKRQSIVENVARQLQEG